MVKIVKTSPKKTSRKIKITRTPPPDLPRNRQVSSAVGHRVEDNFEKKSSGKKSHIFVPKGTNKLIFELRDPELLLSGPAGTGKSRAMLEKLLICALKYGGMRGLMIRKTATSLASAALADWRESVIPEALENGTVRYYGGSGEQAAQYVFSNGSRIVIGGMDKATRIMSTEYDMIYVQEAAELSLNDWESLTTRLRHGKMPYQQLLADCNPDAPTHWLWRRAIDGKVKLLESRHEDNPVWWNEDGTLNERGLGYIGGLDNLSGVRLQRLRYGQWVAAEGIIYEDYDSAVHLIDRFDIPETWARYWSVDFGYTNPQVIQRWAEDEDGRLYLYAEQYMTKRTVDQHAHDVLSVITDEDGNWLEPKPRSIICDHDAEGRAVFERELGLSTTTALKKVSEGIQAVQKRLRPAGDGKPTIFILKDSLVERDSELVDSRKPACTAEEIQSYVWDTTTKRSGDEVIEEKPLKIDDHGMDAMRYVVADRDLAAKPRVRWL